MVSQLYLAQFSHLTFEECHSELCGVFGIPRNGILVVGKLGSRAQTLKCVCIKKMKCTHKNNLVYTEKSR